MNGLPYYKAYPRDFIEGTVGMSFELKGAYRLVLDLIYMQGGELPDDARYISGLLGCTVRKWNSLREQLIEMGKINVIGRFLTNDRAVIELETLRKLQRTNSENRSRPNKNSDLEERSSNHTEPEPEPYKEYSQSSPTPDDPPEKREDDWPEQAWQGYCHPTNRGSKKKALAALGRIKKSEREHFERWVDRYRNHLTTESWRKPKMMQTLLNGEDWREPIAVDVPTTPKIVPLALGPGAPMARPTFDAAALRLEDQEQQQAEGGA